MILPQETAEHAADGRLAMDLSTPKGREATLIGWMLDRIVDELAKGRVTHEQYLDLTEAAVEIIKPRDPAAHGIIPLFPDIDAPGA